MTPEKNKSYAFHMNDSSLYHDGDRNADRPWPQS